ncbi:uncharacterized protein LOC124443792 [Xenia sp. Carnegie-2017]|uniref:uncharacterized protein LOC124443792 n=1 Tax=Xenia sp. Carnegie-2017 TaxID=2897299 RepID=UPI001F039604|nr:uncharacterized protein LOC124443792 [Xenia sp. Carnegie-2017]
MADSSDGSDTNSSDTNISDTNTDSNNDSSSEDEKVLLLILLLRKRRRRLRAVHRKLWTKRWIQRRQSQGVFNNLVRELNAEDPEKFRQFHRLDRDCFDNILQLVLPYITKMDTHLRPAVKPCERLSVTLRFLATGETFRSLSFQFRIGERTISEIVEETCQALYMSLKQQYLKVIKVLIGNILNMSL